MMDLIFQKLTPTNEVDLEGYEEALEFVFKESDIRNVAISGAYSSGKSSIIESYKKKHNGKSFIHLSLSHFQQFDGNSEKDVKINPSKPKNSSDKNAEEVESIIEGKILNQLIQQIPSENIPLTNFRIKRSIGKCEAVKFSIFACVFLLLVMHCTWFSVWQQYVISLNKSYISDIVLLTCIPEMRIISGLGTVVLLGYLIYRLVYLQRSRNILRKISVQGNEIEIFSDSDDSYFDKYLNEVLYLFENSGVDAIVFEDIDRFDNLTIFERLREINTLTNIRLEKKKKRDTKKPLRFIYLLRDDLFYNKDRTKFFDYIIPVVPVIDSSNSYNKIKEYMEKAGIYKRFDDHFLRGISLYIDDLRILKNILNEFLIYDAKLNNIDLDVNKLFAIVTYKNIFPRDFAELQLNRGFVYTLFENKEKIKENSTAELVGIQNDLLSKIQSCENEKVKSLQELEDLKYGYNERARRNYYNYDLGQEYQRWEKGEYIKRKQTINDNASGKVDEYKRNLDNTKEQIERIKNFSLAQLLNRDNISSVFQICFKNEIGNERDFKEIKSDPYFDLLKYIISHGYLDESYSDYMTFFYPNSLSINDKMFLRSVTDRKEKPFDYALNRPSQIIESLNDYDFSQREILNFDLFEYVILNEKNNYVTAIIEQIEEERRYDFISGYMQSEKELAPMVMAIDRAWHTMFYDAMKSNGLSDSLLKTFSYQTISNCDENTLELINVENCLTDYISKNTSYLLVDNIDVDKAGKALIALEVKFIGFDEGEKNEALFDIVYKNDLYEINASNINRMLREKCYKDNIQREFESLFTFIMDNAEEPLCIYLWDNANDTIHVYLNSYRQEIHDSSNAIIAVINNAEIENQYKDEYIRRLISKVDDLSSVNDNSNKKKLIANKVVSYTVYNILHYFSKNSLTDELIDFINDDITILDYTIEEDKEIRDGFSLECLKCNSLVNDKYSEIAENMCTPMEDFNICGLTSEKLHILITLNLIPVNERNLVFIRENYPEDVDIFIRHDFDTYVQQVKQSAFDFEEMLRILTWPDITAQQKIELLKCSDRPVSVSDTNYDDTVLGYILENNLQTRDLPKLVKDFCSYSEPIKETFISILPQYIDNIIQYADTIDDSLLLILFDSDDIDFNNKIVLLKKTASKMKSDDLLEAISNVGGEKIANNLKGGNLKVDINHENNEILKVLFNAGLIQKCEETNDGQHYKKVRFIN